MTQTVKKDFEAANKDNNFIYNDLVPDFGTLEPPGKATLAKPLPFTSPAPNFIDLFANLVPLAVSQALQVWTVFCRSNRRFRQKSDPKFQFRCVLSECVGV